MSQRRGGHVFLGLIILALGTLFLLDNFGLVRFHFTWHHWWPMILIVIGLLQLVNARRAVDSGGWFLILLGGAFLSVTLGYLDWDELWHYWPVILIFIGLSILFRHGRVLSPRSGAAGVVSGAAGSDESSIQERIILSGFDRKVTSQEFRGGDVSVVMGGADIDLREAKLAKEGAVLSLSAVMGGIDIRVPVTWNLEVNGNAILGAVENNTNQKPGKATAKLVVNGSAVMGGVEVKN